MSFTVDIPVRFRDLDGMGHVNNAVYFTYMEIARTEYYREMTGMTSLDDFEFILAHAECDFKAPIGLGEPILVSVWPTRVGESSFTFQYEITGKTSGTLFATGQSVQVAYDYKTKRSEVLPHALRIHLDAELAKGH